MHLESAMANKKLAASKAYSIPPPIYRSKSCKFVKKYFFSIRLLHAHLQYVCNISTMHQKATLKALGGVDFTKKALLNYYLICALDKNWLSSKCCKFVKNYFLGINLLHAHLQYVSNIPAKYQMNILKALGGVHFTKYALLPMSQYVQWSKIGLVKNAVNMSKIIFSANKFFMHIYNMSVTYLQSIKRIPVHQKL